MVKISSDEEELKQLEEELKKLESMDYGSPEKEKKESIFKFFKEILFLKDTTRIGNLSNTELGECRLGVRHFLELSNYATAENLDIVSKYLKNRAGIISSTSMSKKGFWPQLFVTQIKKEQKIVHKQPKKSFWDRKQPEGVEE